MACAGPARNGSSSIAVRLPIRLGSRIRKISPPTIAIAAAIAEKLQNHDAYSAMAKLSPENMSAAR